MVMDSGKRCLLRRGFWTGKVREWGERRAMWGLVSDVRYILEKGISVLKGNLDEDLVWIASYL